jgi:hypothetical protein
MAINAVVVVGAFAGGVVAWAAIGGSAPPSRRDPAVAVNDPAAFTIPFGEQPASSDVPPSPAPASDGGAPSPAEAVDAFLRAEEAGRFDESFLLLSTADRAAYRSAAYWAQAHTTLPPIVEHRVTSGEVARSDDVVEVPASLALEPAIDEIAGLVPGQADATWTAVRESGLWRVSLADSVLTARWPDESEAPADVRSWATGAQECDGRTSDVERPGGLIGSASLADDLCGTDGRVRLGPVAPLDPIDAASYTAAFGEDIVDVARVVPVLSPVELRAVVAPLGDKWLVVGALPPPP